MVDHITLMSKQVVIILGRNDQVVAFPVRPVYKVVATGERVVRLIPAGRIERREIEHHVYVIELLYMRIPGYRAFRLMGKDRIALIALPPLHISGKGDSYALALQAGLRMASPGIIEHDERNAEPLFLIPIDRTLIGRDLLKPLRILVRRRQNRFIRRFPLYGFPQVLPVRPGQADAERTGFVTRIGPADIRHPIPAFPGLQRIAAPPLHIRKRRKSAALAGIPRPVTESQQTSLNRPFQQVITLGKPGLVSAAVLTGTAVVDQKGHVPLTLMAEHRRTVYLVIVGLRSQHQTILVRRPDLPVYPGHALLGDLPDRDSLTPSLSSQRSVQVNQRSAQAKGEGDGEYR